MIGTVTYCTLLAALAGVTLYAVRRWCPPRPPGRCAGYAHLRHTLADCGCPACLAVLDSIEEDET